MDDRSDERWHILLGVLGTLLVAGIVGGIATFGAVKSLDTNVTLFRQEVRREFDWYQSQIRRLEQKLETELEAIRQNQDNGG